jgi:hypothetical protein
MAQGVLLWIAVGRASLYAIMPIGFLFKNEGQKKKALGVESEGLCFRFRNPLVRAEVVTSFSWQGPSWRPSSLLF